MIKIFNKKSNKNNKIIKITLVYFAGLIIVSFIFYLIGASSCSKKNINYSNDKLLEQESLFEEKINNNPASFVKPPSSPPPSPSLPVEPYGKQ